MPFTYYNDNDPNIAQWLTNLISAGLISPGVVDNASITDVRAGTLSHFERVHMFGGIGGWDYALRLAGWPDDKPVWTGSSPCPPFSAAGRKKCPKCGHKGLGFFAGAESVIQEFGCPCGWRDGRNLWPEFRRLIDGGRPDIIFGEQVSSPLGREWFAGVRVDLAKIGYTATTFDIPAAGVGAPHIRQRLHWVANAGSPEWRPPTERRSDDLNGADAGRQEATGRFAVDCEASGMGNTASDHKQRNSMSGTHGERQSARGSSGVDGVGNAESSRLQGFRRECGLSESGRQVQVIRTSGPNFWSDYSVIPCRDGKARRVESGLQCMVDGLPFILADGRTNEGASRVTLLKGFGNSIVPELAAVFIRAYMDISGIVPEYDSHPNSY